MHVVDWRVRCSCQANQNQGGQGCLLTSGYKTMEVENEFHYYLQLYELLVILYHLYVVHLNCCKRRIWVHPMNQTRNGTSVFNRFQQLKEHPDRFNEIFRMAPATFTYLLDIIRNRIKRQDTRMRKAIDPETRLCITLHHLTAGINFRNLAYIYAVGRKTVSDIVYDTCDAIVGLVGDIYMRMPSTHAEWQFIADRYVENDEGTNIMDDFTILLYQLIMRRFILGSMILGISQTALEQ